MSDTNPPVERRLAWKVKKSADARIMLHPLHLWPAWKRFMPPGLSRGQTDAGVEPPIRTFFTSFLHATPPVIPPCRNAVAPSRVRAARRSHLCHADVQRAARCL